MSTFEVKVRELTLVEPHPNADRLELLAVGGYRAVAQKGIHKVGDKIVYIPEDTVFTNMEIARALKVDAYLTGKQKNRVKSIRLRGVLSQGICLPLSALEEASKVIASEMAERLFPNATLIPSNTVSFAEVEVGTDFAAFLELEKYEEPIPMQMAGKVRHWPDFVPKYDLENIKRPESISALVDGEEVIATEKLHGTNITVAIGPGLEEGEEAFVCSRNNALKEDDVNVYWRAVRKYDLIPKLKELWLRLYTMVENIETLSLHGEVVGVQDLRYGYVNGDVGFYAFDIRVNGKYLDLPEFFWMCSETDVPHVPIVYRGPYTYDTIRQLAQGKTTISGSDNILEGVVVRPVKERNDFIAGRVVFKVISDEYLLRKDGTEMH